MTSFQRHIMIKNSYGWMMSVYAYPLFHILHPVRESFVIISQQYPNPYPN